MVRIYSSRFTPGVRGGDINWKIGEVAIYKTREGWPVHVEIVSDHVSHSSAPEARQCREVMFPDGVVLPNGEKMPGGRFCVDADRLELILTDDERAAVEGFLGVRSSRPE